ncbi:GDSL-type esterase/lipase family protein [Roseiconus lacunae]|uniref:GDSL-type esterase/lipase family protein n=1 Tax=Roseiconus lacunae TaxID=2605694 RepID=A0ABT7PPT1_9BACT|nr:GDSL-type esterase/lipase family protein [Roseiconus lacunae]MDM4018510.1 GDSL-type esterase/lipase family protein [Roseiconus lacunae]
MDSRNSWLRCCCLLVMIASMGAGTAPAQESNTIESDANDLLGPYRAAATERWEKDIAAFDGLNEQIEPSEDAILFIGSSSIRLWKTMEQDMAPYQTIRRGYGGAKFTDMAVFAERLITPHQYRAIVMFVGNGVSGKPDDHSPELIESLARQIVATAHEHRPNTPFFLIEITPTHSRFKAWNKIRKVNERLREIALTTPNTYFIATAGDYLRSDATPRKELFIKDQLHLNEDGYRLWAKIIRRRLDDILGTTITPSS